MFAVTNDVSSDSIGGNAKTLMFVCCSPADWNHKESTNSLDFAKRCRNVTNKVVSSNQSSTNQIRMLRAELSKKKATTNNVKRRSAGGMRRPGMA
jgi:kinesin family protein 5